MKRIYISGKISGLDADFVRKKFNGSEWDLIMQNKRFENPIYIRPLFGIDKWIFHLITDIWVLLKCDTILLQPDWIDSRGSKIEVVVAILTGKQIIIDEKEKPVIVAFQEVKNVADNQIIKKKSKI